MNHFRFALIFSCSIMFTFILSSKAAAQSEAIETDESFSQGPEGTPGNESSDSVSGISLGTPLYAGSGCPQGSIGTALSSDNKTLSLLFDAFIVEAGMGTRRSSKDCQLRIPFRVPVGMKATITRLDYRGFSYIPENAKAHFKSTYFVSTSDGTRIRGQNRRNMVFQGPLDADYFVSSKIRKNQIWSGCGEDFTLNIHNEIAAQNRSVDEQLITTLDSSDIVADGKAQYHIQWKRCNKSAGPKKEVKPQKKKKS